MLQSSLANNRITELNLEAQGKGGVRRKSAYQPEKKENALQGRFLKETESYKPVGAQRVPGECLPIPKTGHFEEEIALRENLPAGGARGESLAQQHKNAHPHRNTAALGPLGCV